MRLFLQGIHEQLLLLFLKTQTTIIPIHIAQTPLFLPTLLLLYFITRLPAIKQRFLNTVIIDYGILL